MASFLCRTSEKKLWAAIFESCQRCDIVLNRDASNSTTNEGRGFVSSLWNVDLATAPSEKPMHSLLTIKANYTLKWECLYQGLAFVGVGLFILALILLQYKQSGLAIVCLLSLGILTLIAFLLFSLFANRHVRKLIANILQGLQSDINLQKLEPFEIQASSTFKITLVSMAIFFLLQSAILIGPILGIVILGFTGALFFGLLVVKPRLKSWRSVLHAIHVVGIQALLWVSISVMMVFIMGAVAYSRAYHRDEFQNEGSQIADNLFKRACTSPHSWETSPETIAGEMADALFLSAVSMVDIWLLIILMLMGMAFFLRMAVGEILSGLHYWQHTNLTEHPPVGPAVPISDPPQRFNGLLIGINAIFSGVLYWAVAIISIDAISFLLFGRALVFLPLGWSIEFFKILLNNAGVPALYAYIFVVIMMAFASLPGLILVLAAMNRVIRGGWFTLAYMFPRNQPSRDMMATHGEWLKRTCLQAGIRPARFKVIDSSRPMLSSERSLIPFLPGRIVISSACRELLSTLEIRALLAHEIYHLKRAALYIQTLKALSTLMLCPMYYLLILYDFAHNEYEADAFAVDTTRDVETFKTSLVKLQVASSVRRERRDDLLRERCFAWLRSRNRFFRALPLYFNNSILAAAYPTLQERFAHIDRLWGGKEKQPT